VYVGKKRRKPAVKPAVIANMHRERKDVFAEKGTTKAVKHNL